VTRSPASATEDGRVAASAAWIGLAAAPLFALAVFALLPSPEEGLPAAAKATAAVAVLVAVLWMTEALPLPATALLPALLLPVTGAFPAGEGLPSAIHRATAPYGDEYILLYLGGFLVALAIERWQLHRRIALHTVLAVGTRPARLVGGMMLATALLSMWISNTACAVMMLPIALSVVHLVDERLAIEGPEGAAAAQRFAVCLVLSIAYAASIGGLGTLIGTPPNTFLAGYLERHLEIELGFARWMAFAVPFVAVFLLLAWLLLTRAVFPLRLREIPGGRELIRREIEALGPLSRGERTVLCVFLATAALWILRQPLAGWEWFVARVPAWKEVHDTSIALLGAFVLFSIPVDARRRVFALDWEAAKRVPWGVLLLFGGGLSLASAVSESGLGEWIGRQIPQDLPFPLLVVLSTAIVLVFTELASNVATLTIFLPILCGVAEGAGTDPRWIAVPAALAASCAFLLPAGTPPNAIVFGSGYLRIGQMVRAGVWLNLLALVLIPLYFWIAGARLLGVR
jgi:sodium-dependent dicarboxylate transporter 2/3/5